MHSCLLGATQIVDCLARDFFIVEMKNFAADDLIILVPLAGNQHQIISCALAAMA